MSRRTTEDESSPAKTSGRINIRIRPADKALIGRAAEEALPDAKLLRVDCDTYARFAKLLDKPPKPSKALRQLLRQQAPWGLSNPDNAVLSPPEPLADRHDISRFTCDGWALDYRLCRRAEPIRWAAQFAPTLLAETPLASSFAPKPDSASATTSGCLW